ncbi:hypothetical protein JQ586_39660 [Bradyrhizobium jicamae]|nr:hypothetical protein [Bradyrhizobium jicamae]
MFIGLFLSDRRKQRGLFKVPSHASNCVPIGWVQIRLPVAAKIALVSAGANGGTPGSPPPLGAFRVRRHDVDVGDERGFVNSDHPEGVEVALLDPAVTITDTLYRGLGRY